MSAHVRDFLLGSRTIRRRHLVSIDPCRHDPARISRTVLAALDAGADGFLLGGSTGVSREMIETFAKVIRETLENGYRGKDRPPLILFPSSAQTGLAKTADAVLFLSLLNSKDVRYLIREQAMAAPHLRKCGLEAIGCGMIVVKPGGTVGAVGKADLVEPGDTASAIGYAAAAEAFGFPLIYVNAGSGSAFPVPPEMVRALSGVITVPLIVGGGLTDAEKTSAAVLAGADIIVTGTAIESEDRFEERIAAISAAVHSHPPSGLT